MVIGDDVMVISGLLTPDLGVWRTPTGGGDICITMLFDTQEVDMIPPGSVISTSRLLCFQRISTSKTFPKIWITGYIS
jgi:hypothetical protein